MAFRIAVRVAGGGAGVPPPAVDDNERLIELARRDVSAGLSLLHQRYARSVNQMVRRILGPDPDHDDVVQQVFFTIYRTITTLREPEKLDTWVRTVTVNAVRHEVRKRAVRRIFCGHQPKSDPAADMVREFESRALLGACVDILQDMTPKLRIVFVLHFVQGLSQKEVAESCGCALSTVKRRVKAAGLRFQKLVGQNPDLLKLMEKRV